MRRLVHPWNRLERGIELLDRLVCVGDQAQDFKHYGGGEMRGLPIGVILGWHQAYHVTADDVFPAHAT